MQTIEQLLNHETLATTTLVLASRLIAGLAGWDFETRSERLIFRGLLFTLKP